MDDIPKYRKRFLSFRILFGNCPSCGYDGDERLRLKPPKAIRSNLYAYTLKEKKLLTLILRDKHQKKILLSLFEWSRFE